MRNSQVLTIIVLLVLSIGAQNAEAQIIDRVSLRVTPTLDIPIGESNTLFDLGGGVAAEGRFSLMPLLSPYLRVQYDILPTPAANNLTVASAGIGAIASYPLTSRVSLGIGAGGGYYAASWDQEQSGGFFGDAGAEASYRFTPAFSASLGGLYRHFLGSNDPLYQGVSVMFSGGLNVGGLSGGTKLEAERVELDAVFPIFHAHYDENPLGSVRFTNHEDGEIQDVRVSFFVKQYMDQPKVCAVYDTISRGRTVETPLYALFTDQVLRLTESTRVGAEVIVDYTFLGATRQTRFTETLRMHHRNAMTWDDDRKAAAFVSAKDPAVLRFSKFAAGLFREAESIDLNENLRFALGLLEGLRLYGLNYVIDPTTPYEQLSADATALDYVQYPYQTLTYRGGDCDDLSVLFAAVLESVGIRTAFVTIPGHIYMAFALDMDEKTATRTFQNPEDLIFFDGEAWVPVEVTVLNEGFTRAWLVGAKQWRDNIEGGNAEFLPIGAAWEVYQPVGIPGEDTRVILPEADELLGAYREGLVAFVERELAPQVAKLEQDIRSTGGNPRIVNRLGVLYARFGMYDAAGAQFEKAIGRNYLPAVVNYGNTLYLKGDYAGALVRYQAALARSPNTKEALLGVARAEFELQNYSEAGRAYVIVEGIDPQLASEYPYLASRGDAEALARASGAAVQRRRSPAWAEE